MTRTESRGRGQGLVEMALVLPIFLLIIFGMLDLGRAVYAYNTISNSSRAGARVAIVNQTTSAIQAEAISQSVALGVTAGQVSISYLQPTTSATCPSPISIGCRVSITVTDQWTAVTPVISQIIGPITLQATTEMPVERTCPWPPGKPTCP